MRSWVTREGKVVIGAWREPKAEKRPRRIVSIEGKTDEVLNGRRVSQEKMKVGLVWMIRSGPVCSGLW